MGDWTSGTVTIHACPPHRVRTVLAAFAEYGLVYEDATNDTTLHVGECYSADEFRCGSATRLTTELIKQAPEGTFTVYEEPAFEWLGTTCTYVPGLGLFSTDCGTTGDPLFSQTHVLELEDQPADVRQQQLGVPWLTAIATMPTGSVVEPDRFATHWNRRHNELIVIEGKQGGGDLIFPAPVTFKEADAALAERGFQRADDWTQLDETSHLWRTDVYRRSSS
jgi:hypothetical protein